MTVDLPAPLGPISAVTAAGGTLNDTDCTARTPPNVMVSASARSTRPARPPIDMPPPWRGASAWPAALRRQRDNNPATPSGAAHSTTSRNTPKNSRRYSSRLDSSSGSRPTTTAPSKGPARDPAPPSVTASTNRIDCMKLKLCGVIMPVCGA
ncbi:hypothetical protein D3C72_938030 [compost metagenome]